LGQAEQKLETLQPSVLHKKQLDKLVRELQLFRTDVMQHSSEYESNKLLGETFINACDIDKEGIKNELANMKQRLSSPNACKRKHD
jgi:dystonin